MPTEEFTAYTLKRVPRKPLEFYEHLEHDVFLSCFFGTEDDGITPKLSDNWDSKNTQYWEGNTDFTSYKGRIKYSLDKQKIINARNYNINHNKLEGSYIGIVEVTVDQASKQVTRIGEEVYFGIGGGNMYLRLYLNSCESSERL